jgi:hypothetical protein
MLLKPEEVGLSSARLGRIGEHFQRYIGGRDLAREGGRLVGLPLDAAVDLGRGVEGA